MNAYKVIISSTAQLDISEIVSFVLNVSKEAAIDLANTLYESLSSLDYLPERYPIFEMPKSFRIQNGNPRLFNCRDESDLKILYTAEFS